MARGSIEINKIAKELDMVLKSYKTTEVYEDDEWEAVETRPKTTMKNIFIDSKIKKLKFSDETSSKLKFANINSLMKIEDGFEGYLGAYSELEFIAYRFQKIHGMYPDMLRIQYVNTEKFLVELFKYIKVPKEAYYKSISEQRGDVIINSIIFAFETSEKETFLYVYMDNDEAVFFYDKELEKDKENIFNTLIALLRGHIAPGISKNKIFVVYQSQHGFEKTGFDVKKIKVDLEQNYNDNFPAISEEIIAGLNDKKKSNLVILSGEPGVGKTTYIRYLTSKIKKNIIFIAPDMVNHITDPSFIPFLIKNNDTVLIIEDGEPALQSRDGSGRTGAVSNILNLTDGLLSDCLNISIVVTFNMEGKDIDKALLRKGRLLKNYKFEKLTIDKSKKLLEKEGKGYVDVKEPMTLADIYFYEADNNSEEFKRKKVGF
jgi:hypothetical protein